MTRKKYEKYIIPIFVWALQVIVCVSGKWWLLSFWCYTEWNVFSLVESFFVSFVFLLQCMVEICNLHTVTGCVHKFITSQPQIFADGCIVWFLKNIFIINFEEVHIFFIRKSSCFFYSKKFIIFYLKKLNLSYLKKFIFFKVHLFFILKKFIFFLFEKFHILFEKCFGHFFFRWA